MWLSFLILCVYYFTTNDGFKMVSRIGVDYGPNKIGIAVADIYGNVKPFTTITNTRNLTEISLNIIDIARMYRAEEVVVGLPADNNGRMKNVRNFNGQLCHTFSRVFSVTAEKYSPIPLPVVLSDERFSTKEAIFKIKNGEFQGSLDAVAAACILQHHIEGKGQLSMNIAVKSVSAEEEILDYGKVRDHTILQNRRRAEKKPTTRGFQSLVEKLVVPPEGAGEGDERKREMHIEFLKMFKQQNTDSFHKITRRKANK